MERLTTTTLAPGRHRFTGQIAGAGFADGTRIVLGRWQRSPLGAFTDAMVERPNGHRVLLAPTEEVADVVSELYRFDEVQVVPVIERQRGRTLVATLGPLELSLTAGPRRSLGWLLRAVPTPIARAHWWSWATNPIASIALAGVHTRGTTASGQQATYGATDLHSLADAHARWDGVDLGRFGDVTPSVRFGFGSTPPQPSLTSITTTVTVPPA